jgi:hypothetical protein
MSSGKTEKMLKIIVAAAVAVSFVSLDVANAASKKKKQKVRATAPVSYVAPANLLTPGPPWRGPGECYTDEGYGRYSPCGEGKDM